MINALGLLEVRGLTCGIEAADAMLKAAPVRLLRYTVTKSAMITLVIEGDLAACNAALEAGAALATRQGSLISRKEIGRPDGDTAYFVSELLKKAPGGAPTPPAAPTPPVSPPPAVSKVSAVPASGTVPTPVNNSLAGKALLAFLAGRKQGYSASEVAAQFDVPMATAQSWLQALLDRDQVRLRSSRYRPIGGATK